MTLLDRIKELCKEKGISQRTLERELELGNGASSKWAKSSPSGEVLEKLANYFDVSIDWLLGKTQFKNLPDETELALDVKRNEDFTTRDKRDIAKTMDFMLEQLDNHQEALMFDGEVLDDQTRELLKDSLLNSLKMGKVIAKKKYTPNKYKK